MAVCVTDHRYLRLLQQLLLVLSVGSPGSAVGLFAVRELKILAEGDVERYQVIRAISLVTMTITPYLMPDPWNSAAVIAGSLGTSSLLSP